MSRSSVLVTRRFVFLHMPKTGGGTIARVLREFLPPSEHEASPRLPYVHPGWDDIPPFARDRPVLAFVRNPWDWYVSWYHFLAVRPRDTAQWRSAFGDGQDFAASVRVACNGALEHDRPEVRERIDAGEDFYSARLGVLLGAGVDDPRLTVGRFERLAADLEAFLRTTGTEIGDDFGERFARAPVVHRGERGSYRDYYDDELRELVATKCSGIIERYGYAF